MTDQKNHSQADTENRFPVDDHEEIVSENGQKVRRRGVYLLPNLFTSAALFSGFYAIVAAMNSQFTLAAIAIFVAMVFDGLDGRVARLTQTQSAFGAEYDSLSDMVSFGVAPALVCYSWAAHDLGKVGWMACFLYAACTALRLARFNTSIGSADKRFFIGLPCPSAAALIAALVWSLSDFALNSGGAMVLAVLAALSLVLSGLLMVCNIRFHSFKEVDLRGRVHFVAIIAIVLVLALFAIDPPRLLLGFFFLYAISGPIMAVTGLGLPADIDNKKEEKF